MIRCIVVDDEQLLLEEMVEDLKQCDVDVIGTYQDPRTALDEIEETRPDVAFLDIEMPGINGIELAKKIQAQSQDIHIVFVTAYKEYAVKAFGVRATHYLLKPVDENGIKEAIDRVMSMKQMGRTLGTVESISLVKNNTGVADKISLNDKNDIVVIKLSDILYFTAEDGITSVVTKRGEYKSRKNLNLWEAQLKELDFVRCHKSYLVNANYIYKMKHVLGEYKELQLNYCDVRIPISRRKTREMKEWLGVQ